MELHERLKLCERCKNRKFDFQTGLICSLTDEKPKFEHTCPDFIEDPSALQRKRGREVMNERMKKGDSGSVPGWRVFLSVIIMIFAIVRIALRMSRNDDRERQRSFESYQMPAYQQFETSQRRERNGLTRDDLRAYRAQETTGMVLPLDNGYQIEIPEGFSLFPHFQNDNLLLVAYANNFLVTCEKYETKPTVNPAQNWQSHQYGSHSNFPLLPFSGARILNTDNQSIDGSISFNFTYPFRSFQRHGHTEVIEANGYIYYVTISARRDDYRKLEKYLFYYLKQRE